MPLTATPLRLSTVDSHFEAAFQARLHWAQDTDAAIETSVAAILRDVQQRGDAAVLEYTAPAEITASRFAPIGSV